MYYSKGFVQNELAKKQKLENGLVDFSGIDAGSELTGSSVRQKKHSDESDLSQ